MEDIQKNILVALYSFFEQNKNQGTGDKEIAKASGLDIDRVRVCLKNLKAKGYVELIDASNLKEPERIVVNNITSEGRLAVKDNL